MRYLNFKLLILFAALAMAIPPAWAGTETDVITIDDLPNIKGYTTYQNFTGLQKNTAIYAGNCAGGSKANPYIQIRKQTPSGIVTTTSGGKVNKVTIEFNTATATNTARYVDVYCKNTAYTSSSQLYTENIGTKVGTITYDGSNNPKELTITGDYEYVGLLANAALYIDKITIEWQTPDDGDPWISVSPNLLSIGNDGGIFTVSASNMPNNGLGVFDNDNHDPAVFSFSATEDNTFTPNFFPLDNGAITNGHVKVNYTGYALSFNGTIGFASGDAKATAGVNYLYDGDIYIVGDLEGAGWSTVQGIQLDKNADGTYSKTVTATAGGEGYAWVYFTKSLDGANYNALGNNRFGPVSNETNWPFTDNLDGVYCDLDIYGNLHTIKLQPGTYTFTINPATNQFMIEKYEAQVLKKYVKVTGTNQLVAGKKYIFVHEGSTTLTPSAMGPISNKFGSVVSITLDTENGIAEAGNDVAALTLGGTTGHYTLQFDDGNYLNAGNGTNLYAGTATEWVISNNNGNATLNGYRAKHADYNRAIKRAKGYERYGNYSTGDDNSEFAFLYVEDDGTPSTEQVAKPTFSPAGGDKDGVVDVTINCATEDATIYYTLDGTDPTTSSNVFNSEQPIHLTATTTIKAIAVKAGMDDSEIATAAYNLPGSVATLATANGLEDDTKFIFTGEVVVTYNNGKFTWLRDRGAENGGGVLNNNNSITVPTEQGTVWKTEWNAKKTTNTAGRPQFGNAGNIQASGETASYAPFDRTGVALTDDHMSEYIILKNVKITDFDEDRTYVGTCAGENRDAVNYTLYNYFNVDGIEKDRTYDITGVVSKYEGNAQVYPTAIKIVKENLELSFEPARVELYVGQEFIAPTLKGLPEGENLTVNYVSGNTELATVTDNVVGLVNGKTGEATITANVTGNNYYNDGNAHYLIVVKPLEAAGLSYGNGTDPVIVNATYGDGTNVEEPTLTNEANLPITYASSDTTVVKVNANGEVTIVGAGEATITATTIGDETHSGGSASYFINVAKANAEFKFAKNEIEATYGDETVEANPLTNDGDLAVTYTCEPEGVVTIDANGKVTEILKAGEVTIIATGAENDNYNGATATYTLTVAKADATLAFAKSEIPATYGDENVEANALTNEAGLTITYSCEPATVATVDANTGAVTIVGAGEAIITATGAANDNYNGATATYTLTVAKADATLAFAKSEIPATYGDENVEANALTNEAGLTVTYSCEPATVATVDANTGAVTIVGAGEAIITATGAANDNYNGATATYTINVGKKNADVSYNVGTVNVVEGQEFTAPELNNPDELPVSYESSNSAVATVDAEGNVTIVGVGEAVITATIADSENYNGTSVSYTIVVSPMPVVAKPTFNPVPGSYTTAQNVTIACETPGVTIKYSTDGGNNWTEGNTLNVGENKTIMAKAVKDGYTESEVAKGWYIIEAFDQLPDVEPIDGYFSIKNNGNEQYVNIQGRKTLTFTNAIDQAAGTVIRVQTNNKGQVQVLRSQAADLQGYADRAMRYVPEVVNLVVNKLHAEGSGDDYILGEHGLDEIMDMFNECFDAHLYVEEAQGGYRIYGKTPNMQHVVDFYRDHQNQVEAKLPMLEDFINNAIDKAIDKANGHGTSILVHFSVDTIWNRMGGQLTRPVDEVSTMAFYREVLNNKQYVWDFAYQTATFYLEKVKAHPRYEEIKEKLGDFGKYIDKLEQVRPDMKYYIVQMNNKPDYISEGNADIKNNEPRTIWTLEPRSEFKVNFPAENVMNGGKEYVTTLYTDFAYDLLEGVTAYTVTEITSLGIAKLNSIGTYVPAQTPVILKSTEAGMKALTINMSNGTAPANNLLCGPDYLIKTYEIKTPQIESLFDFVKNTFGETFYNDYVAQYEHLMLKTAGTVNNKYFWGLSDDDLEQCTVTNENNELDCVTRTLSVGDQKLGFYSNWEANTNQAFLVSDTYNPIRLSFKGDVNRDGKINIADVAAQVDIMLNLPSIPEGYAEKYDYEAADFNENGEIKINDVTALINFLFEYDPESMQPKDPVEDPNP